MEKALIIFYRIEAVIVSPSGEMVTGERKELQKMVKVQSLNPSTDVSGLAKEVVQQCKMLIPASKLNEVQQLLNYLKQRPDKSLASAGKIRPLSRTVSKNEDLEMFLESNEKSSMSMLDSYIELLYEEGPGKMQGTSMILQLAKNAGNLLELSQNETLVGVLYRVLREDGRRHYALAINIALVFFYFSSYSNFHLILTRLKVGSLLMEVIRWELQRFDQWHVDLKSEHSNQGFF